jgi:hypothetical protein
MKRIAACILTICPVASTLSATVEVDLERIIQGGLLENIQVFVGDSVKWLNGGESLLQVQGLPDEWKSPILHPGESYTHTFTEPSRFLYKWIWYSRGLQPLTTNVASVFAQPFTGDRPAISIISPPEGFFVYIAPYEAAVSASVVPILAVNFFRDGEFIAAATNAPYRIQVPAPLGIHQIWAESLDASGHTNTSPHITLTHVDSIAHLAFNPVFVPNVGFAFNYVTSSFFQPLLFKSDDLKNWLLTDDGLRAHALILLPQTNLHHAFFKVRRGPS